MEDFAIGQRWINDAELQMGLGTVQEVAHRTVTISFEAAGENRTYAKQTAPLTRILFSNGDTIHSRDGLEIIVESVKEFEGRLSYMGKDEQGNIHELDEILLNDQIQLSRPSERLFSGQVDNAKWHALRYQSLQELNRLGHSSLRGLNGCRTSLIPHQLYIAHEVAHRFAPRVLLADEVGLGKTIEAGLILHQQLLTERARRVLIIVPETLVHQWLVEMLRRFNLHFSIFDEDRFQAILEEDETQNPFHSEQLVLCSLDFLSSKVSVLAYAIAGDWDLLVVDEAHHLQWSPEQSSTDYQAVERLAAVTKGVLLLTATPEQLGKAGHFARLRLLDPRRFPQFDKFIEEEKRYEPIAAAIETLFSDDVVDVQALGKLTTIGEDDTNVLINTLANSNNEEEIETVKLELIEHLLDRHGTSRVLFRNTRSAVSGFPERVLFGYSLTMPTEYTRADASAQTVHTQLAPELAYMCNAGKEQMSWTNFDPRVMWLQNKLSELRPNKALIIAASARTALDLAEVLRVKAGMHLGVFHEGMSIIERDRAAAYFADKDEGCQALICSEIGSEGRNFQFAHNMILFDLPLNPDLLEQRIGRLDRIGQNQTIHIHVPYLQASAQEVMFFWLHEGLNAFVKSCPAAATLFEKMHEKLISALLNPDRDKHDLIAETQTSLVDINESLQRGRDKLLEVNSCRPLQAQAWTQQALQEDRGSTLAQFMDSVFDCFGVHTEEHSTGRYILRPGENMLTAFPYLPDDGMTITYDREIALSHEDIHFLSWDHPMVSSAMDIILSSELGNTSLIAMEHDDIEAGTLLLENIYIFESASSHALQTSRYLPPTTIRTLTSEHGDAYEDKISHMQITRKAADVDRGTSNQIIQVKMDELKQLTRVSKDRAHTLAPEILSRSQIKAELMLTREIKRLKALNKVNPNIRHEEIEFFEQQLQSLQQVLNAASLRLDAVRVIITT